MKTPKELEELETLRHETGLRGDALQEAFYNRPRSQGRTFSCPINALPPGVLSPEERFDYHTDQLIGHADIHRYEHFRPWDFYTPEH